MALSRTDPTQALKQLLRAVFILLLGVAGLLAWGIYSAVVVPLDRDVKALENWRPLTTVTVVDRFDQPLDRFSVERRTWVPLDHVPQHVVDAFVAAEDRRFYMHPGVDPIGIVRAAFNNWQAGTVVEGGSTLTQQLLKNVLVGNDRSLQRKIREALAALLLERRISKDEIIEQYINLVYLGSGNYGIEAASKDYFGRSASELDVGQAALLAGLVPAPSNYSPRRSAERALERRNAVLADMYDAGMISADALVHWETSAMSTPEARSAQGATGSAYRTLVRRQVRSTFGDRAPYRAGLLIRTPYDPDLQLFAEQALRSALWGVVQRQANEAGRPRPDEIDRPWCDGAAVVLDNESGGVVAVVGGYDVALEGFVRTTQGMRQPGSAFKPIVYATALNAGRNQLDVVQDAPLSVGRWSPKNYANSYRGPLTLRRALAISSNTVAVRVAMDVGVGEIRHMARDLGIITPLRHELPIALGASEVSVMELASAYATIARGGRAVQPMFLEALHDMDGSYVGSAGDRVEVAGRPPTRLPGGEGERVLSPGVAAELTDMLAEVVRNGTGRRARSDIQDRAGKTGTTSDYNDAWFVGFTPNHTIAVWIGTDDGSPLGQDETGSRAALPAWIAIADALSTGAPERFRDEPDVMWWPYGADWVAIARGQASEVVRAPSVSGRAPLPPFPAAAP